MLLQASADKSLWAEALLAFVFVKNCLPHAALNSKVPLAVWHGRPVRVDMPRIWGCRAWHTLSKTNSKLDTRAVPLVIVGYDGDTRAYRLLDPESKRIVRSHDTRFQEDLFPLASASPPTTLDAIAPNPPTALADDSPLSATVVHPIDFLSDLFAAQAVALTAAIEDDMAAHDEAFSLPSRDPRNHREALTDVDRALDGEKREFLTLLNDYKVFHPVDRSSVPPTAKILGTSTTAAKAMARRRMHIHQADVDKAYLHADLHEELYMRVPDGLNGPNWDGKVLKLDRALYGLKQARRAWNAKIHATLERLGYCCTISDICVYIDRVKGGLREQYGIKDLGDASCILGIDLVRRPDGSVFLSQRAYLETVLTCLGQLECHTAPTPMIPNQQLIPVPPDSADDPSF
ncbi:hypothetical protein JCM21900_001872 [Sporobolomyces salmonicolor]